MVKLGDNGQLANSWKILTLQMMFDDSNDSGPNIDGPMINDWPIMDRIQQMRMLKKISYGFKRFETKKKRNSFMMNYRLQ